MAILVDRTTRVLVQGITGKAGRRHTRLMLDAGTKVVGGVTPGKGGSLVEGVPVFDAVREAVRATGATVSVLFVPGPTAAGAVLEAVEGGLDLAVCVTEGIPVLDMVRLRETTRGCRTRILGPNCPGVCSPGGALVGIMPASIFMPGGTGVVSRSGTLTYEAVDALSRAGIGQSTCLGIGGDPVHGLSFADCLRLFAGDPDTDRVLIIGEIGGEDEEVAAALCPGLGKPVAALVAGRSAPPERRMGHAGAIISLGRGGAAAKTAAFRASGVPVCASLAEVPAVVASLRA